MEKLPFSHSEQPDQQLTDRLRELREAENIPHVEERRLQIAHEAGCISFELMWRRQQREQVGLHNE